MNLIIDIGNSFTKVYLYSNGAPKFFKIINNLDELKNSIVLYLKEISHVIVSDVKRVKIENVLSMFKGKFIFLVKECRFPFKSRYKTMNSLGDDRIALVNSAFKKFPNENVLIIDIGTCITYDFIDSKNIYHGGAISPGINMRYNSLNKFTSNLPLLEFNNVEKMIGSSTDESIHIGVYNGIIGEINEYINRLEEKYLKLNVIITGGDSTFLLNKIKNAIFADQDFLAIGLNNILKYNEGH